jgi:hypothetical protein
MMRDNFWNVTKQTVLDALKQGIDAPYLAKAEFAAAVWPVLPLNCWDVKNSILTDKEIADGLITCQAHPYIELFM